MRLVPLSQSLSRRLLGNNPAPGCNRRFLLPTFSLCQPMQLHCSAAKHGNQNIKATSSRDARKLQVRVGAATASCTYLRRPRCRRRRRRPRRVVGVELRRIGGDSRRHNMVVVAPHKSQAALLLAHYMAHLINVISCNINLNSSDEIETRSFTLTKASLPRRSRWR